MITLPGMRISLFRNATDTHPQAWAGSWSEFCVSVIGTERGHTSYVGDKLKSPAFSPAEYPEGATRGKAKVTAVHLAVLDYDGIPASALEAILRRCEGNRFLLYTSYSHVAAPQWRVRLVFDLDRPVPAADWPTFWSGLAATLPDDSLDQTCKDASRIYFLPYTPTPGDALIEAFDGAPLNVAEVMASAGVSRSDPAPSQRSQTVTLDDLKTYAKRLANRSNQSDVNMGRWLGKIAKREEYALPGSRHNTALTITAHLERAFPDVPVEELAHLFEGSLHHMRDRDRDFDPAAEVIDITNSLRGARERRLIETQRKAEVADAMHAGEIRAAFRTDRIVPYTEDELRAFAAASGVSVEDFHKMWIVTYGPSHYIFVGGEYRPPVPTSGLLTSVRRDLAPAYSLGVNLQKPGDNGGKWTQKTRDELLRDYGTESRAAVASYLAPHSYYDTKTQTIYEAVCPAREIEPVRSEVIDGWLRILGGEHYDALQLWLKLVWDLSQPLAALYLEGAPGAGKSLFAAGVSRIWGTTGPTPGKAGTGKYTNMLLSNPVVFADEHLPDAWMYKAGQARFREFIAERSRVLERKYLASIPFEGCTRVILAANNQDLLRNNEILSEDDRSAIIERLFHLHVTTEAANYLKALGEPRVRQFVVNDELAAHAAWLRDNLALARQGRFGVSVGKTALHETMQHSQPIIAALGEWLIGYLLDPDRYIKNNRGRRGYIKVVDGELLVNINAVRAQESWTQYVSNPRDVPSSFYLGRALAELSAERRMQGKIQFRVIDLEGLIALAERTQLASRQEILDGMSKVTDLEKLRSN